MKIRTAIMVICTVLFFVTPVSASADKSVNPEKLAQCLVENGAIFFGAWWCPACKAQKQLFGEAAQSLPYVECDSRGDNSQVDRCRASEIHAIPTWIFSDGTRAVGVQALESLKEQSGC